MLSLPPAVADRNEWQHAAALAIKARQRPGLRTVAEFTDQLELALMLSWRLDFSSEKRPPAPSVRKSPRWRLSAQQEE